MPHQLKSYDAVKCETVEEWVEILRLAAIYNIGISHMGLFKYFPVIVFETPAFKELIISYDKDLAIKKASLNFFSFQDFCAKIKGEYKEKEFFITVQSMSADYVIPHDILKIFPSDATVAIPPDALPFGKYKLTRITDE